MKVADFTSDILSNPHARQAYYEQVMKQRREALQATVEEEVKIEDSKFKIPDLPAAEAWMLEHPEEIDSVTAPTRSEFRRLTYMEHLRTKATRVRFRELGIR
jgi:hypothetical protein